LLKQLDQQHNLMAVLTGRFPGRGAGREIHFGQPEASRGPAGQPALGLVAQRPDVLQAEANMHAASAQVGIATANRLPNISLTANAGSTALSIGQVFGPGTGFWNLGAALLAPIFDGGTLKHQQRAARAAYTQSAEQYRATVLTAFQQVADSLTALDQDARTLKATAAAADAARRTLDLSKLQYKDGYAGYLAVLNAEQSYQQARLALVQAEASRFADTAALFQALGGGWWRRTDLEGNSHAQ
jgi:NodT family efflux transporter outer membrane factor (OMF) lipoprotein